MNQGPGTLDLVSLCPRHWILLAELGGYIFVRNGQRLELCWFHFFPLNWNELGWAFGLLNTKAEIVTSFRGPYLVFKPIVFIFLFPGITNRVVTRIIQCIVMALKYWVGRKYHIYFWNLKSLNHSGTPSYLLTLFPTLLRRWYN